MSLDHFQQALLELYTKPQSLQDFFADQNSLFNRYELTERERTALIQLPRKNLKGFQHDLAGKRAKVARKVLDFSPHRIVIAPFSKSGSAVASWGSPVRSSQISAGMFLMLKHMASTNQLIGIQNILDAYVKIRPKCSAKDVFLLARLMYSERLIGKEISAPS